MVEDDPSPIVWCSDGPRLVLADGSVVRLLVENPEGEDLPYIGSDQGASMHGFDDQDGAPVRIAVVDDPEAVEDIEAVRETAEYYRGASDDG